MMFEAFGFSEVSSRCRILSQLPSGRLLWQASPLFLNPFPPCLFVWFTDFIYLQGLCVTKTWCSTRLPRCRLSFMLCVAVVALFAYGWCLGVVAV